MARVGSGAYPTPAPARDKSEAARRYAALSLRPPTPKALLENLWPCRPPRPGQQTVVAIIVGGERWHAIILRRGARVMPPAAFSTIVANSLARCLNMVWRKYGCAMHRWQPTCAGPVAKTCPALYG